MTEVGPPRQGSAAAVRQRPEPCAERICRTRRRPPRGRRSSPATPTDRRVGEAHSLEHILPSIVDRLPDKASRELAFGLAASVIVADGRTPLAELNILKALQDMFDLSEEDVARLFETAQSHGEFPPTKGK